MDTGAAAGSTPTAWWRSGVDLHLDRRVSDALLQAVSPGGPLHGVVAWRDADRGLRDVQFRRQPKGPASWVSLYLGLTSVLDVYEQGGLFSLRAHDTHRTRGRFDSLWQEPCSLEDLAARWSDVEAYLARVVPRVDPRWLDSEGRVHALLAGSTTSGVSVLDREASIAFRDQPTKDALCAGWTAEVVAPLLQAGVDAADRRLGTSPDLLAVDDDGRLLVIEVKPASAAAGIAWGPVQVGFYARMYAAWLAEAGDAAVPVLQGALEQRRRAGLTGGPHRRVAEPVVVVPVLAVGPGVVSPEAWARAAAAAAALDGAGDLPPLEVWRLAGDGTRRVVALGADLSDGPPADTEEDLGLSTFQERARAAAVAWKLSTPLLPAPARADGPYARSGVVYPFCLPREHAPRNLLPEAAGAVAFFAERGVQWHRGVEDGPTTHLVSSQVQCVNALFAMTSDEARLRRAFGDVVDLQAVDTLDGALLTFEYNGDGGDHLGESRGGRPLTRGAHSTSTDAAFAFRSSAGRELALVEWKYTEQYGGSRLSPDPRGLRERYRPFYEDPAGPLDASVVPFEAVLVEPLYQLVRQQLLAWRLEQAGAYDRVRVLHVVPSANDAYWRSLDAHEHRLAGETVADLWQRLLRPASRDRYVQVDSARFLDPAVTSTEYVARYGHG